MRSSISDALINNRQYPIICTAHNHSWRVDWRHSGGQKYPDMCTLRNAIGRIYLIHTHTFWSYFIFPKLFDRKISITKGNSSLHTGLSFTIFAYRTFIHEARYLIRISSYKCAIFVFVVQQYIHSVTEIWQLTMNYILCWSSFQIPILQRQYR